MTREEAIGVYHGLINTKIKEAFEFFAPELAESEDERIRKEIVEFIEWSVDRHFMREDFHQAKRPSEWIAYLEKHKYDRMQPIYDSIDSFESALDKAWKAYNDSGARTVDGCEDDYVECAHAKGFREGYLFGLEKQKEQKPLKVGENAYFDPNTDMWFIKKEQKPAEWSEEDKKLIDDVINSLCCYQNTLSDYQKEIIGEEIRKLKSLKPQQKQEWSDEDEDIRQSIIKDIKWERDNTPVTVDKDIRKYDEQINWLKSLRPQPKVELSEDVKKTLDEVSHILIWLNYKQVAKDYKQAVEKLLSLRPSWEPSEEQEEPEYYQHFDPDC